MFFWSIFRYALIFSSGWLIYKLYVFTNFVLKLRKYGKAVNSFPMPPKHWLWGHMKQLSGPGEESLNFFTRMVEKHPKAFGMFMGNFIRPYVVIYDPEIAKMVMTTTAQKPDLLGMYGYGKYWIGQGLSLSNGSNWHRKRRLLTPAFHFETLKNYSKIFNESSELLLTKLSNFAESRETFEAQEILSRLTLDIILKCAFSYDSGALINDNNVFYSHAIDKLCQLWMKRYSEPWKHSDLIYYWTEDGKEFKEHANKVNAISEKLIKERKQLIENNIESAKKYEDFLNILLMAKDEDGVGLTDMELRGEVNTFIFAGFDTTAASLSWILYSLATHPEYQKRCQKEVDDLFEGRSDEYIGWNDLNQLNYLHMCIKESMRLYGGVPFIERELGQNMMIDGQNVPIGTSIMVNLFGLHRNPAVWKDPLIYDPERFSEENIKKMHPFAFVPFAAGSRNCIGQAFGQDEMKIALAKILRRFTLTVKEDHVPVKMIALLLRASNGLFLRVSKR